MCNFFQKHYFFTYQKFFSSIVISCFIIFSPFSLFSSSLRTDLYDSSTGQQKHIYPTGQTDKPILGGVWVASESINDEVYSIHKDLSKQILSYQCLNKIEKKNNICQIQIYILRENALSVVPFGPFVSGSNSYSINVLNKTFSEKLEECSIKLNTYKKDFNTFIYKDIIDINGSEIGIDSGKFQTKSQVMFNEEFLKKKDIKQKELSEEDKKAKQNSTEFSNKLKERIQNKNNLHAALKECVSQIIYLYHKDIDLSKELILSPEPDEEASSLSDLVLDILEEFLEKKITPLKKNILEETKGLISKEKEKETFNKLFPSEDFINNFAREEIEQNTTDYMRQKNENIANYSMLNFKDEAEHLHDSEQQFFITMQQEIEKLKLDNSIVDIHLTNLFDMCPYCLSSAYLFINKLRRNYPNSKSSFYASSISPYQFKPGLAYHDVISNEIKEGKNTIEDEKKGSSFFGDLMRALGPYYKNFDYPQEYIIQFIVNPLEYWLGKEINPFSSFTKLTSLNLINNNLGSRIKNLKIEQLTSLTFLDLSNNQISEKDIQFFENLKNLKNLKILDLRDNIISDNTIKLLTPYLSEAIIIVSQIIKEE